MPDLIRQTDKPLFPDILWSRPLTKSRGGRILIVGGQKSGFSECQAIYQAVMASGAGECVLALPDSLYKTVGLGGVANFVPSSASGSLGKAALGYLLELAADCDAVIIAGNLTNNSETAVLVESLISQISAPLAVGREVVKIMNFNPKSLTDRKNTLIVLDTHDTLGLAGSLNIPITIQAGSNVTSKAQLVDRLASISKSNYLMFNGQIFIPDRAVYMTDLATDNSDLSTLIIGCSTTFWVQNRSKPTEALVTAAYVVAAANRASAATNRSAGAKIIADLLESDTF